MTDTKHSLWTRLYRGETSFDFVGRRKWWFLISGAVIGIGLIAMLFQGLNFSIDFKGGSVWEVQSNASVATARDVIGSVNPALRQATIEILTDRQNGVHTLRISAKANAAKNGTEVTEVSEKLARMAGVPVNKVTLNTVGPTWGGDITQKAERALVIFLIAVVIYISFRFETKMAVAALVALVHDILVTAGVYSISGFQVSPATVIAFLTILGYSLYDTVVVFDKIEENTKGLAASQRITYTETVNLSMNQVLMRSINTSTVAILPILSILVIGAYFLGASALEDFGLALFIGLLTGAYSSIFIASPLLAVLKEREPRYSQIRQRLANRASVASVLTPAAAASGELAAAMGSGGSGGGGGGRRSGGAGAGSGVAAAKGKAAKAGSASGGVSSRAGRSEDGYEGPVRPRSPRPAAAVTARTKAAAPPPDEDDELELDEGADEIQAAVAPAKGDGKGGTNGAGAAAAKPAGVAKSTGASGSSGGANRQAPRPRPGAANRSGGSGANRGAPRPRKKGKRR